MTMIKKSKIAKKAILTSMVCASALFGDNLGTINVESSTVNVNKADSATEASTVSYIDSEQIAEIGARNVGELLQTIPGVTADVRPGEVVEIHMRGVGQQEFMWEDTGVAIIVDGVPVYARSGKFRLNMSDIKSIKVVKGSASYLYGNTASAGAVIITTSRPKGDKNFYSVSGERGSWGYQDYNGELYQSMEDFALNLNVNSRSTDGYWYDSSMSSKSFGGKFTYYVDDSSDITVGIDKTTKFEEAARGGVTGVTEAEKYPRGTEANAFQKENDVVLDKYFVKYNKEFENGGSLLVNLYDYKDEYDFTSSPKDTTGDGNNDTYSNHSLEHKYQKGVKLEYKQSIDSLAYMVGYELGDRQYTDKSKTLVDYNGTDSEGDPVYGRVGEFSEVEDNQKVNAYYAEVKYGFTPELTATINMRNDVQKEEFVDDSYDYNGSDWIDGYQKLDKTFNENSYRAGVTYNLSNSNTIFANVATGFRTPTLQYNISKSKTGDLTTQTSITYEIGNRGTVNSLDYEVTLFETDTRDIIGYKNGTYSFATSKGVVENIGDAQNRGMELSLKSDPKKVFSFDLAYTYLKAIYTKHNEIRNTWYEKFADVEGNVLPRTSEHTVDLYTTYKATDNLKIISEIFGKSSYYSDETNKFEMPGYAYMNLQARHTSETGNGELELFAKVNNIFDNHYYMTAYTVGDSDGNHKVDEEDVSITVAPGRELYAGVKYKF